MGLSNARFSGLIMYDCKNCGETSIAIPKMSQLTSIMLEAVLNSPGILTGKQLKFLRKAAFLSPKTFAEIANTQEYVIKGHESSKIIGIQTDHIFRSAIAKHVGIKFCKREGTKPKNWHFEFKNNNWKYIL